MLFVFAVILADAALTLVVKSLMLEIFAVILLVFAVTRVSNAVMLDVAEFTVPVRLSLAERLTPKDAVPTWRRWGWR